MASRFILPAKTNSIAKQAAANADAANLEWEAGITAVQISGSLDYLDFAGS